MPNQETETVEKIDVDKIRAELHQWYVAVGMWYIELLEPSNDDPLKSKMEESLYGS